MELTTSRGQTFDIQYIGKVLTNSRRMMIELEDERRLSEIAADFEDVQTFRRAEITPEGKPDIYEGYTNLVDVHRNTAAGNVRLTLERSDAYE